MRQIEKNALVAGLLRGIAPEKMAASSADITDQFESREITTFNNCGDLSPGLANIVALKMLFVLGMCPTITPDSFRKVLHRSTPGFNDTQARDMRPNDRQSKHPHKAGASTVDDRFAASAKAGECW